MTLAQEVTSNSEISELLGIEWEIATRNAEEKLLKSLRNREDSAYEILVRSYGPRGFSSGIYLVISSCQSPEKGYTSLSVRTKTLAQHR